MFGVFGDTNSQATVMGCQKLHRKVVGAITGDQKWLCVLAVEEAKSIDLTFLPGKGPTAIGGDFDAGFTEKLSYRSAHVRALATEL